MANVTTVDITTAAGSDKFPLNENDFLKAVETIAQQNVRAVPNTNRIEDAFYDYPVENGKVIEEAIIKMAEGQAFAPTADGAEPSFSPKDPTLYIKYFNNWKETQYKVTQRPKEINAIMARGETPESVAASILATLSEGEGYGDYSVMRKALEDEAVAMDCSTALFGGKVPASMKGAIYALRQMYNVCRATNDKGGVPCKQGVPSGDIRIAVSEKALNLMDVTELANVFNLSKVDLFGKLVVLPYDDQYDGSKALVYDRKHFGRGTREFSYGMENLLAGHKYVNNYLNTDRAYFNNSLFKCFGIDLSKAMAAAEGALLTTKE